MRTRWLAKPGMVLALISALITPAASQSNTVTVRLYSLHPQQHVRVAARSGKLSWHSCEKCASAEAADLVLQADGNQLRVLNGPQAEQILVEGDYRIEPQEGMKIALAAPLRVTAHDGLLTLIAIMPLEDYVAATLEGESAIFTHTESLKAMAVAVRTYAARFRPRHGEEGFDFCDNTHCQNLNFTGPMAQVRAAVEATRGQLLWYQGSPAATYYHQNCGGTLAAGEEVWPTLHAPYLREHTDLYCVVGAPLPWKAEFPRAQLEAALRKQGLSVPAGWASLAVDSRGASGRALRLAFRTESSPPKMISASTLRFAVGRSLGWNRIRSDLYEIENTGDSVIFNGRGAGHGVGLCQAGAEEMARQGKTYKQILDFYYPGTQLGLTAQGLAWQTRDSDAFQLKSTQPDQDAEVLTAAKRVLDGLQSELSWTPEFKIQLRVFASLEAYRNATGQPGWIAAYTRGHVISLQPLATLKEKGIVDSTLRHELTHIFVESRARAETPLWFREGLVLYLAEPSRIVAPVAMSEQAMEAALDHPADRESLDRAYAAARTHVAELVERNGHDTVLHWLSSGLPGSVRSVSPQR
ncbi:MAG TPA: SpoIID/LytB domain-containing protein [Candidatus Angelobacter sp.]|nr:SpoIID/LytB domain-containing protein [Candidatus Angelobacter sp.]